MKESLFAALHNADAKQEVSSAVLAPGEILLGTLAAIDQHGQPRVSFAGMPAENGVVALSTVSIAQQHLGRQVALLFANGDVRKPVIIGIVHSPLNELLASYSLLQDIQVASTEVADKDPFAGKPLLESEKVQAVEAVRVDGKRVVIEGQEEIVLNCGESSITLTKAGKILIRGKYVLSRSSGVNRILGGSVQVN